MLPKENRIKKEKDFELLFKKGNTFKNDFFIARILPNNQDKSRFAIITSQKVSKKAVKRNKIRRRVSCVIEKNFQNIKQGSDCVIIVLPSARDKNFTQIKEKIENLLKNVGLIN